MTYFNAKSGNSVIKRRTKATAKGAKDIRGERRNFTLQHPFEEL